MSNHNFDNEKEEYEVEKHWIIDYYYARENKIDNTGDDIVLKGGNSLNAKGG